MKDDRRLLRLVIVVLVVVGTVMTTGRTDAYGYDVSSSALVSVLAPSGPEVSPVQPSVAWEKPTSPSFEAGGASTTPLLSSNATNNVIVDTNAVYNRPGTLGALQPGETPVMTRTTVGELANNAASGRLKPPRFANELGVVDDVMDVNTRINIRGELEAIRPGQRGLFGDGSIGATAVNTGYPVITADKNFATVLEGMGVQVRRI